MKFALAQVGSGVLVILCLLQTSGVVAQPISSDTFDLKEAIVTGDRIQSTVFNTNAGVLVIDRATIDKIPARSVNELLTYVSGLDLRQRGAMGVQGDISLRGGTFEQTLVMLNGVKISDPQTGHHQLNLPVNIENIERIEVVYGAASRKYGQNAFTGAINIITKPAKRDGLKVSGFYGDWNLLGGNASVNFGSKTSRHLISVDRIQSGGYRHNSDFNTTTAFYQSSIETGKGPLEVMTGLSIRKFGANGFYASPNYRDQYEETSTYFGAIQSEHKNNKWRIIPRTYFRFHQDYYSLIREKPEVYKNNHKTMVAGAEVHATRSNRWGVSGVGLDYRYEEINSTNLGNHFRNLFGVFVEHKYEKNRWNISPGIYANYYSEWGLKFFPGVDAGYRLNANHRFFGNVGKSYRIPTYTDLFYVGPTNIGNENLQPEMAFSYEVGWKYYSPTAQAQLSLFQRDGRQIIDWTRTTDTLPWKPENLNQVIFNGLEFSSSLPYGKWLSWEKSAHLMLSYTYLDAKILLPDDVISRYALENLRHQFIVRLVNQWPLQLHSQCIMRVLERVNAPNYFVLDSRVSRQHKQWLFYAEATNIMNQKYTEAGFVPMPNRWIRGGFSYAVNFKAKER